MDDDVVRILPGRLCLSDSILLGSGDDARWARVVGLALDGHDVLATCAGQPAPVRLAGSVAIRVQREHGEGEPGDDEGLEHGIATGYPGDLRAAGSAVLQHAAAAGQSQPGGSDADISHYPGLYGGDLEHVVDALGGTPGDLSPADLRTAAFQRSVAARRAAEAAEADEADDEDSDDDRLSGPYSRDFQPSDGDQR
jgi:hypothetical protein